MGKDPSHGPGWLKKGHCAPIEPRRPRLARHQRAPVTPDFQKIMRQAHQTPFTANLLEASQEKATETPPFLDLTKHWFRDDLASGVQRPTWLAAHFGCHALLGGFGRLWCCWRHALVRHTTDRYVRVKTHLLQSLGGGLTVIPIVQCRHDRLGLTPVIRWPLNPCLLKRLQGRLGHRFRLFLVV